MEIFRTILVVIAFVAALFAINALVFPPKALSMPPEANFTQQDCEEIATALVQSYMMKAHGVPKEVILSGIEFNPAVPKPVQAYLLDAVTKAYDEYPETTTMEKVVNECMAN